MIAATVLAIMAFSAITMEIGEEGRFKLSVDYDNVDSPREHARAQLMLHERASELCDEIDGDAASVGAIELNSAEPFRGERRALRISMEYVCLAREGED